jgi:hypothetical protein
LLETRFITDASSIGTEYSFASLANLPIDALRSLLAHVHQTSPHYVQADITPAVCAHLIWEKQLVRGFRYLVATTPLAITQPSTSSHAIMTWPCPYPTCTILCAVGGHTHEATYALCPGNGGPFSPASTGLLSGDPCIFPPDGTVTIGDSLLVDTRGAIAPSLPSYLQPQIFQMNPLLSTSPAPYASHVAQMTQTHHALADKLVSANRKASDGTRIVSDVGIHHSAAALQPLASTPSSPVPKYSQVCNLPF